MSQKNGQSLAFDFEFARIGKSLIVHADCLEWLRAVPESTLHAIVTDPPYGVKEYEVDQLAKRANGRGGVWRIPPSFDGHVRAPLPRFTALDESEREAMRVFFVEGSRIVPSAGRPCIAAAGRRDRHRSVHGIRLNGCSGGIAWFGVRRH